MHVPPPDAGEDRLVRIRAGIRRHEAACGCELASLCLIGAGIAFLAYVAFGPAAWSAGEATWRGIAWVLSAAVAGKLAGLAYAALRLRMYRAALRRELAGSARILPDMLVERH